MKAFVMSDEDFDLDTEEGRRAQDKAIIAATRRVAPHLAVPHGGSRGGIGKGRIVHNNQILNIK